VVPIPAGSLSSELRPGAGALKVRAAEPPFAEEDFIFALAGEDVAGAVFARVGSAPVERLISIGGIGVTDIGQAEDLVGAHASEDPLEITTRRAGSESRQLTDEPVELLTAREYARSGGQRARVWRNGEWFEHELPANCVLRPTVAPLWHGPQSHLGTTPLARAAVPREFVVLLIRAPGYDAVRYPLPAETERVELKLDPSERFPEPFRRTYGTRHNLVVMDREVTVAEYAEYLEAAPQSALLDGWRRRTDGSVVPPEGARERPISGTT